jgi:anti-anti-sigma regulatory factor
MTQKFQAAVQHRGDVSYVKLGGVIDEDNDLGGLIERIPAGTAVIDLGEIERINSCGVRDWVNWLAKLEGNGARSVLVECSPAIVAQINLVNNFTGSGVVKSFYVPYFCPECDEEKVLLVEAGDMGPPPHEPPTCRCDECDLVMDFDDMPDSYFAFLSNQRKLASIEPQADKINGAVRDLGGGKGKVKSRASAPMLSPPGGQPSVPSLPSIQRASTTSPPVGTHASGPRLPVRSSTSSPSQPPPSGPRLSVPSVKSPSAQGLPSMGMRMQSPAGMAPAAAPPLVTAPKGNAVIFVLVGVLVAAICVLGYLVLK